MRSFHSLLALGLILSPIVAQAQGTAAPDVESGHTSGLSNELFVHLMTLDSLQSDHAVAFARQTLGLSAEQAQGLTSFAADAVARYRKVGEEGTRAICEMSPSPTVRDQIISQLRDVRDEQENLRETFLVGLTRALGEEVIKKILSTGQVAVGEDFDLENLRDQDIDLYAATRGPCP